MMSNIELIEMYYPLIQKCCMFTGGKKWKVEQYTLDDLVQDIVLIMYKLDNEKLNLIHQENHMNAWITGIINRQVWSDSSDFYKAYRRLDWDSREIEKKDLDIPDTFNPFEKLDRYGKRKNKKKQ